MLLVVDGMRAAMLDTAPLERSAPDNRGREKAGQTLLYVGVGVATGPVSLGVLGSESRKSVTVIESHVNMASRLQGQAKANQMVVVPRPMRRRVRTSANLLSAACNSRATRRPCLRINTN